LQRYCSNCKKCILKCEVISNKKQKLKTMKKIGMVFPVQGAQSLGMGKELFDKQRIVQDFFDKASHCLGNNFVRLCFASSERELRETINAQTSIFLVSSAIATLLKEKYDVVPDIVAGHSSGEYAAIFAAGGMTFADALYLLKKRAEFMDLATKSAKGGMMAVMGLSYKELLEVCQKFDEPLGNEVVAQVVNYNSPKQLVVSGTLEILEKVQAEVRAAGAKSVMLKVAGAFHSRLMNAAAEKFAKYMVKVDFKDLQVPLVSNINADIITTGEQINESLKQQMNSHVQWWPSMQRLKDCDVIIQVGPGEAYVNMLSREWPEKTIIPVNTMEDIEHLLQALEKEYSHVEHEKDCDRQDCARGELQVEKSDPDHDKVQTKGAPDITLQEVQQATGS